MAHAIFNVSPVKFLSSIQDHVFTVTPTFKNKTFSKSDKKKHQSPTLEEQQRNSSASPVTLQLTLPTDTVENPQMTEIQHNTFYEAPSQQLNQLSPPAAPIDIPRSYPLNVPMNNNSHHSRADYEGLAMSNNLLSTSYGSHHSYSYRQENNLISLANSISRSPYQPAEDLTLCFDGLAVRSPTGSFYSNGGVYSPQQIHSPINIGSPQNGFGSPHHGYGSPQSPVYFDGGCSPHSTGFNNTNFFVGSPSYNNNNNNNNINSAFVGSPSFNQNSSFVGSPSFNQNNSFVGSPNYNQNNSFVGSPNSPSVFLGSPALSPVYNNELTIDTTQHATPQNEDLSGSYGFTYLSPTIPPQQNPTSPINSPSPTGSYANNLYLFPPSTSGNYSRPSSPVPDDVILTASEVNDYINSPYSSVAASSPSVVVQPSSNSNITDDSNTNGVTEFLFGQQQHQGTCSPLTTTMNDIELFPPSIVSPSSPHAQPQRNMNTSTSSTTASAAAGLVFSEDDDEVADKEAGASAQRRKKPYTTTPSGRRAKIHKCPYCNHTSNRANNMREHTQIHNPNRPKPHACKLCNRAFARKHDMNRHYISCKKQHSKSGGGSNRYVMTSPPLHSAI